MLLDSNHGIYRVIALMSPIALNCRSQMFAERSLSGVKRKIAKCTRNGVDDPERKSRRLIRTPRRRAARLTRE